LPDTKKTGAVREIDVESDDPRFAQEASTSLRAKLAIGDVVDQSGFAVLCDADAQVCAHAPIELLQIAEVEFVCGHAPEQCEASAVTKFVQDSAERVCQCREGEVLSSDFGESQTSVIYLPEGLGELVSVGVIQAEIPGWVAIQVFGSPGTGVSDGFHMWCHASLLIGQMFVDVVIDFRQHGMGR
jgi:hypothetical protein